MLVIHHDLCLKSGWGEVGGRVSSCSYSLVLPLGDLLATRDGTFFFLIMHGKSLHNLP